MFTDIDIRRIAAPVDTMEHIVGGKRPTWWSYVKDDVLFNFKIQGKRYILIRWPGDAPAREGRAPSLEELILEQINDPAPLKTVPEGVHRGRPRKAPPPTDAAEAQPQQRRRGRPRKQRAVAAEYDKRNQQPVIGPAAVPFARRGRIRIGILPGPSNPGQ